MMAGKAASPALGRHRTGLVSGMENCMGAVGMPGWCASQLLLLCWVMMLTGLGDRNPERR